MKPRIFVLLTLSIALTFGVISQCKTIGSLAKLDITETLMAGVDDIGVFKKLYDAYDQEFTPKEEYYIGRAVAAFLLQKYTMYGSGSSAEEQYINKIGNTLAMASTRPGTYQGYRFIVIKSNSINAFAVPSGYIFITTGLINSAENEDQLAGVLAHEVCHISLKHPTNSISESRRNDAISGILAEEAAKAANAGALTDKLTGIFKGVISEVASSVQEGYDTDKERQADLNAVNLLVQAGYNPQGLAQMLRKLKNVQGGVHGNPNGRANDVEGKINQLGNKYPQSLAARDNRFKSVMGNKTLAFIPKSHLE